MYMRKKAYTLIALVLIIMSMIMSACTKKDNLTGDNWSGIKPQLATVNSFEMGYSYTHEGTVKGNESYLICGSEGGIEAVSILNFIGLTDTMTVIGQPTLKIVATRRSGISRSPLELTFHKLNKNWAADSTNNVLDTDITPLNFTYSVTQDTISSAGDTLTINIPAAVIQNWKTENVTGLNLVIKLTGTGWLEFKATELAGGPLLSFEYQIANSTTNQNYSQKAVKDSYRISGTENVRQIYSA